MKAPRLARLEVGSWRVPDDPIAPLEAASGAVPIISARWWAADGSASRLEGEDLEALRHQPTQARVMLVLVQQGDLLAVDVLFGAVDLRAVVARARNPVADRLEQLGP
jgi:hypothetical protein